MINSVAGYEMVDVTGLGRFVTGGILPVREGGARRALKYEDLLFLKEGKLERTNWRLAANTAAKANKAAAPSRWLEKNAIVAATCSGTWGEYRDAEKEMEEGIYNIKTEDAQGTWHGKTTEEVIEEVAGSVVALDAVDWGRTPKLEKLEKAYENMGKLKRTLMEINVYDILASEQGETIEKEWDKNGNLVRSQTTQNGATTWTYVYVSEGQGWPEGSIREGYVIRNGTLLSPTDVAMPYAKKAWILIVGLFEKWKTSRNAPTEYVGSWDIAVRELTVTPGQNGQPATVSLAGLDLDGIMEEMMGNQGVTMYDEPQMLTGYVTTENINADFSTAYLLIEHEFPATEPEEESGSGGE